uniref:NADH-ubiquinone oxidoreductase chain 4 n=1 Tax=Candida verbasci TaxID=1227364 RepID=A0A977LL74_9ASCO|nr:NADH dehydrogenase subunit 4 [Candida verbasci]UXG56608.1 NADH dehydrogenase subunit 4 [Candida verbasci]
MTTIYGVLIAFTSVMARSLPSLNKSIMLVASITLVLPTTYDWDEGGVYYTTDGIADVTMLLTVYLLPLSIIANWNSINSTLYYELMLGLGGMLTMNFTCQDMLSFYVYFEASLAPLFIVIGLYGANNRDKASDYVLLYTLLSSLFMLMAMATYELLLGTTDYQSASLVVLSIDLQCVLYLCMAMGVMVKTPLMPVHTWLPVVHSESPLAGSMTLAGMVTKLAIYATMRLVLPTLSDATMLYTPMAYVLCVMTMMYTSLMTMRQTDLKVMVAYSSVSHMAVCMLGMLSNSLTGMTGSTVLCVAHGLVSPALFIMVGGITYDRYHHRLIYYYQGTITYMPLLSVALMMFSFCNVGTPLSVNFIGELTSLSGAIGRSPILGAISALSVTLSASYMTKVTNRTTGGIPTPYTATTADLTNREIVLLVSLMMPTTFYGMFPNGIINTLWDTPRLTYTFYIYIIMYFIYMYMKMYKEGVR